MADTFSHASRTCPPFPSTCAAPPSRYRYLSKQRLPMQRRRVARNIGRTTFPKLKGACHRAILDLDRTMLVSFCCPSPTLPNKTYMRTAVEIPAFATILERGCVPDPQTILAAYGRHRRTHPQPLSTAIVINQRDQPSRSCGFYPGLSRRTFAPNFVHSGFPVLRMDFPDPPPPPPQKKGTC
ncbi:hypothetical protein LY78DRAFT_661711 [Colletotrichum sublineola]|nr:hypothetical protein LY78DRAFT_661711 [Colletotrichum sublineola]